MKSAGDRDNAYDQPDITDLLAILDAGLSPALLERALTHRSYAYEHGGLPTNERLEFLGDSVLGLVVTDTLFRGYPDMPEGQLAKLRAAVVNMRALAGVARGLLLGSYIRLGRGEEGTGGRDKSSILADTLEAVIGAVYIERGLDSAGDLVHRLFDPVIARAARLGAGLDWKTSLQELAAAGVLGVPEYQVDESGPDHQKTFRALVRLGGRAYGSGEGHSKKEAEQQAAEAAWQAISNGEPPMDGPTTPRRHQPGPAGTQDHPAPHAAAAPAAPAPDGIVPGSAVPGSAGPDGIAPGSAVPGSAVPDSAVPGSAGPDGIAPDSAVPDGIVPGSAGPDGIVPGSAVPDGTIRDGTAPDGTANASSG